MSSLPQDISLPEYSTQFEPLSGDETNLWEALEILKEARHTYLVKWGGVDPSTGDPWQPSWVPKRDCTDDLIYEWKIKAAKKKQKTTRKGKGRGKKVESEECSNPALRQTEHVTTGSNSNSSSRTLGKDVKPMISRSSTVSSKSAAIPSSHKNPVVEITRMKKRKPLLAEEEEMFSEEDSDRQPHKKKRKLVGGEVEDMRNPQAGSLSRGSSKSHPRVEYDNHIEEDASCCKQKQNQQNNRISQTSSHPSASSPASDVAVECERAPKLASNNLKRPVSSNLTEAIIRNLDKADSPQGESSEEPPSPRSLLACSFISESEYAPSSQSGPTPVKVAKNSNKWNERDRPLRPVPILNPIVFKAALPIDSQNSVIEDFTSPIQKIDSGKGKGKAIYDPRVIDRREEEEEEEEEKKVEEEEKKEEEKEEPEDEPDKEGSLDVLIEEYEAPAADDELRRRGQKLADDANARHPPNGHQQLRRSLNDIISASSSVRTDSRQDDVVRQHSF
jgi:hypothetical protein